jgi:hypothetical protein
MKTGPDASDSSENESKRAKHENGTWRPRYRGKLLWEHKTRKRDTSHLLPSKTSLGAQNMKTGPDDLDTVENGTRCPQYRRKQVQELKT